MKTVAWIIVALLLAGGAWWYIKPSGVPSAAGPVDGDIVTETDTVNTAGTNVPAVPMTATVIYGAQGFSPPRVTIAKGGTVTWVNQSGRPMWVASGNHPSHTLYSGTSRDQHCPDTNGTAFDECAPGNSYTFTFQKTGTWGYHNHMSGGDTGTVIVQ